VVPVRGVSEGIGASIGKLRERLEQSYEAQIKERKRRKELEARRRRLRSRGEEEEEVFEDEDTGDDEDGDEGEDEEGEFVPFEDAWLEFLRYVGWTDYSILARQPDDYVHRAYTIYQIKAKYGKLNIGMGMF
jgi:hypothetical protein